MVEDAENISRKIRLRQLRCFVTVARLKSFVAAAKALGLTQPSVSRSVRELEDLLGRPLFDRATRGAELTEQGRDFFPTAEASLAQIHLGTRAVLGQLEGQQTVQIGALPNVCSQFLPELIASFKTEVPNVRVVITPGGNKELLSALRQGERDFVIGRLSTSSDMRGLVFEALYDEPLVFVVRNGHPLAKRAPSVQAITDFPLVLPPEGTIIRQEIDRYFTQHGVTRVPDLIETISSDFQRAYTASTDSVTVIPRGVVQADLADGSFVQLTHGEEELRGPVGLTLNPEQRPGGAVEMLLQRIRRHALST
ncbi:MAG: pca operon transcription factor PcaQ [Pseudomonadota bacterium]